MRPLIACSCVSGIIASAVTYLVVSGNDASNSNFHDHSWYSAAVNETGEFVNYPIMTGTWTLTEDSRNEIIRYLNHNNREHKEGTIVVNPELINSHAYAIILTGRHVKLYDDPTLLGVVDKTPYPMVFFDVGKFPFADSSNKYVELESRGLAFGVDAPAKLVTWRLVDVDQISHEDRVNFSKSGKCLLLSEEYMPDIWHETLYAIKSDGNTISLTRKFSLKGVNESIDIEWQKISNYRTAQDSQSVQ